MSLKVTFAEKLLEEITDGKFELQQGVTVLISGGMGSGKTTFLLHLLDYLYADGREVIFWRGREVDQWHHADRRVQFRIFHHVNDKIRFEYDDIKQYYELEHYRTVKEIFEKADNEFVNVVYPPSLDWEAKYSDKNLVAVFREYKQADVVKNDTLMTVRHAFWYSFIYEMKKDKRFCSLIFDEFDDIAERYCKGFKYYMITFLMDSLRYFRQIRKSLYGATQVVTDIDPRILGKIMYHIYMAGAKLHKESVLDKSKVKFADKGQAFIEDKNTGTWAKFEFPPRGIITPILVQLREGEEADEELDGIVDLEEVV